MNFFPPAIVDALKRLNINRLNEIRLRADKPVRVCVNGKFYYLSSQGLTESSSIANVFVCNAKQIAEIVLRAAEFSIYAFNNQLCDGYITIMGGIRIGVAGEAVYEGDKIKTQKNFTSLVIRIPHEIFGCADIAFKSIFRSRNKNTLIISPPGCGKTTLLRDLSRQISNNGFNTLLVDERSELAACINGTASLDVGINTDIICNARKDYAFRFGIRSLRPDYVVTDELMSIADIEAVRKAALSGVNVVASLHAQGVDDIKNRPELIGVLNNRIFGRYIILKGVGNYDKILDESLNVVS